MSRIHASRRVFDALGRKVTPYEPGKEIAPGITSVESYGHTPGHNSHIISSGNSKVFVQADVTNMVADGELNIGITFNPNEPANLVAAGRMPASAVAWQHRAGTIGNTHFVAIPANASAKAAAQVFANFLLSPEAQAKKNDLKVWGDPTVLAISKLVSTDAELFAASTAPGSVTLPAPALLEPHASWVGLLEGAWLKRYGKG